jgi:hypothetical protein
MSDDLDRLREAYERALTDYEAIILTLNRRILTGTRPEAADNEAEQVTREQLERARRAYLDAWSRP